MSELKQQHENISRVQNKLGDVIMTFCEACFLLNPTRQFESSELYNWVYCTTGKKPTGDSPLRILRKLAQDGRVNYECISRARSIYKITALLPKQGELRL